MVGKVTWTAFVAVLLLSGWIAAPGSAQTTVEIGPACGGHWVAPGAECNFTHQMDPVPFGGFAFDPAGGATVTVEIVLPEAGPDGEDLVLDSCTDEVVIAGIFAWCGKAGTTGMAAGTVLVCRVRGYAEGGFGCGSDP